MENFNITQEYFFADFLDAINTRNCDLTHVLRKHLHQAVEAAEYHAIISNGEKAQAYRSAKSTLLDALDELDKAFSDEGKLLSGSRSLVMEAITIARRIIAIRHEEERSEFDFINDQLALGLCDCCHQKIKFY